MKPRLNKYLVTSGLADSRRKADVIIKARLVTVNGDIIDDLSYRVDEKDKISVRGIQAQIKEDIYIAYYKPRGEICSHRSYKNDKTIFDSLPRTFSKLKIAGRLDKDSEGLILLSSDGDFIHKLSHPSMNKTKAYLVTTKQHISDDAIRKMNEGIKLEDGLSKLKVSRVDNESVKIIMSEGRNRQIRRTLDAIELEVVKLVRVRIGNYTNSQLRPMSYLFIKPEDVL